jgi:hypothetical protein
MKRRKTDLYLLYQFKDSNSITFDLEASAYHVILLFSESGEVPLADYKKIAPDLLDLNQLNFRTKEELIDFAKSCLNHLDFDSVYLLASNDFNIGIESCHDLSSFREIFDRYGYHVTLKDMEPTSKNLFGKLF